MGAVGTATLDFGSIPGSTEALIVVTGQAGVLAGSYVEAWIRVEPAGSTNHSMDEHRIETLKIVAGNIVAGTGFTIYGECAVGRTYGTFTVNWIWA